MEISTVVMFVLLGVNAVVLWSLVHAAARVDHSLRVNESTLTRMRIAAPAPTVLTAEDAEFITAEPGDASTEDTGPAYVAARDSTISWPTELPDMRPPEDRPTWTEESDTGEYPVPPEAA